VVSGGSGIDFGISTGTSHGFLYLCCCQLCPDSSNSRFFLWPCLYPHSPNPRLCVPGPVDPKRAWATAARGTKHVLPTWVRPGMSGGCPCDSFMKYMTVQSLTEEGLQNLGPSVAKMAEVRGAGCAQQAVTLRLADLK